MEEFIKGIPKCELHLHMFGNIEPETVFMLAERNNVQINYKTPEELRAAYEFKNLDEFLKVFRDGMSVIKTKRDVYDVAMDYFKHANQDNVKYCELHINALLRIEGLSTHDSMTGLIEAMEEAKKVYGIESKIISSLSRQNPIEDSWNSFEATKPYLDHVAAFGLANSERNNPPHLFTEVYDAVGKLGLKKTAHAGEDGPAEYIWEAINDLKVDRIDHGNSCIDDPKLVEYLAEKQIPLTMCPISNLKLKVITKMEDHPLKKLLDAGVMVTVNSDDPSFFGGYVAENYIAVQKALNLTREDIITLAKNSFKAAFLPADKIEAGIRSIDEFAASHQY